MPVTAVRRYRTRMTKRNCCWGSLRLPPSLVWATSAMTVCISARNSSWKPASTCSPPLVFWDTLRYVLTLGAERENALPTPPLTVDRKRDSQNLREAFADNSIVIGYDIRKKPVRWPDEVRVMQANGFGMTGAGKTTLLLNIIQHA